MEEAARMSGAGMLSTIWRISLRLAMPAIVALAIFVFIRSIEAFEVPALVGLPGKITVLTTEVYLSTRMSPPDYGHAAAFAVVLSALVIFLFYLYGKMTKSASRYHSITGKGFRPRVISLGAWRYLTGGLIFGNFLVLIVVPIIAMLWLALLPYYQGFSVQAISRFTSQNFRALAEPYYMEHVINTIVIAAGSATIIMVIATIAGWIAARRGPHFFLLEQLATLPLVFPGIVLGLAVMQIYIRVPIPIYGTIWIILIAYIITYMPYGLRYVYSGVLQIHNELEEAAGVSGASEISILRRVVAPLLSPALISGWLFLFLIATKELAVAVLLSGPRSKVIAVAMYDLWSNGQGGELAAFGLVWTGLMTIISFVFFSWARRRGAEMFAA